jgi:hypothetical protein
VTRVEYITALQNILNTHAKNALVQIDRIKNALPSNAQAVEVGIYPWQDGEGFFDVMIHLCGPDLSILNKAMEPYRILFEVKFVNGKPEPDVPMFDPYDVSFSVNDIIVDVGINWVKQLWALSGGVGIPAYVFGDECSSSQGRILLNTGNE